MSVSNGNVTAPVGLYEVCRLLNEPSLDTATACLSKNINPYSLIQPAPASYPSFGVENMEDGWEHGASPVIVGSGIYYDALKWGYWVPYVTQPAQIPNVMNLAWVRRGATGFKCLNHFDGYQHNAKPSNIIVSYTIETGKTIAITMAGVGYQQNIITLVDGVAKGNKGGVVAIPEVFKGKSMWYGFSLFRNNLNNINNLVNHYISLQPIDFNAAISGLYTVNAGTAESETDYYIVPFITDGSNYYSLKYAEDYQPYIHVRTGNESVYLTAINITQNKYGSYDFSVTIVNSLPTTQQVSNGTVISSTSGISVRNQNPAVIAASLPANSSKTITGTFDLSSTPTGSCYVYIRVEWTGGQTTPSDPIPHLESPLINITGSGPEMPREDV